MRKSYSYALGFGDGDSYFARRSYRFGVDWIATGGALLALLDDNPCRAVVDVLDYAKKQYTSEEVRIFVKRMRQ